MSPHGGLQGSERNTLLYRGASSVGGVSTSGNGHWQHCVGPGVAGVRAGRIGRFDRHRVGDSSSVPFQTDARGEDDLSQVVNYAEDSLRPAHRSADRNSGPREL
jgi:hypothetical protein